MIRLCWAAYLMYTSACVCVCVHFIYINLLEKILVVSKNTIACCFYRWKVVTSAIITPTHDIYTVNPPTFTNGYINKFNIDSII